MGVKLLKAVVFAAFAAAAALSVSCDGGQKGSAKPQFDPSNEVHKVSYMLGRDFGARVLETGSETEIDVAVVLMAVREAIDGKAAQLSDSALSALDSQLKRDQRERQRQKRRQLEEDNMAAAQAFLESNKASQGVVVTETGLQYTIITEGTGAKPKMTDRVKVHYHGTLPDGTVFESSRDRGEPYTVAVTGQVKGWTEALQLMKVGSKYKLFVPPELAYGRRGSRGPIGPNMALIFEIELLEIEK